MRQHLTLRDAEPLPDTRTLRSRRLHLEIAAHDPATGYQWVRVLLLGVDKPNTVVRFWLCLTDPRLVRGVAGRGWSPLRCPLTRAGHEWLLRAEAIADAFTQPEARIMLDTLLRYGTHRSATLERLAVASGPAWDANAKLFRMRLDYTLQRLTVRPEDQRIIFRWQSARDALFAALRIGINLPVRGGRTGMELLFRGPAYPLAATGAEIV